MQWLYLLSLFNFVKRNSTVRPVPASFKIGSIIIQNDLDEFVRVSVQLWVQNDDANFNTHDTDRLNPPRYRMAAYCQKIFVTF